MGESEKGSRGQGMKQRKIHFGVGRSLCRQVKGDDRSNNANAVTCAKCQKRLVKTAGMFR